MDAGNNIAEIALRQIVDDYGEYFIDDVSGKIYDVIGYEDEGHTLKLSERKIEINCDVIC